MRGCEIFLFCFSFIFICRLSRLFSQASDELSDLPLRVAELTREQRHRRDRERDEHKTGSLLANGICTIGFFKNKNRCYFYFSALTFLFTFPLQWRQSSTRLTLLTAAQGRKKRRRGGAEPRGSQSASALSLWPTSRDGSPERCVCVCVWLLFKANACVQKLVHPMTQVIYIKKTF